MELKFIWKIKTDVYYQFIIAVNTILQVIVRFNMNVLSTSTTGVKTQQCALPLKLTHVNLFSLFRLNN